jgi:recombination protein RecR
MFPPSIQKLIDLFSDFPTVGPRTAARFIFYLLKLPEKEFQNLLDSLKQLRSSIKTCQFCFNPFEEEKSGQNLCAICQNPKREKTLLCIVEKETDLISIEKTKKYNGIYFILGGNVSALEKDDLQKVRVGELEQRIKNPEKFGQNANFKEIIIALNSTTEGEATGLYLERKIKSLKMPTVPKTTHLARGLPVGGELEYADEETVGSAFEGRK